MILQRNGKQFDLDDKVHGVRRYVVCDDRERSVCECVGQMKTPNADVIYRYVEPEFPGEGHMCFGDTWARWGKQADKEAGGV